MLLGSVDLPNEVRLELAIEGADVSCEPRFFQLPNVPSAVAPAVGVVGPTPSGPSRSSTASRNYADPVLLHGTAVYEESQSPCAHLYALAVFWRSPLRQFATETGDDLRL